MTKHIHVHLHRAKANDAWNESEHKRNHGQFSSTGGSGGATKTQMHGPSGKENPTAGKKPTERNDPLAAVREFNKGTAGQRTPAELAEHKAAAKPAAPMTMAERKAKNPHLYASTKPASTDPLAGVREFNKNGATPGSKPAPNPVVAGKGGLYLSGFEPKGNEQHPGQTAASMSSAAKNATRAATRSVQGGSGDPHELHMAASKAHAEAAKAAQAAGDRVSAQQHSDYAITHKSQAAMFKPAASASAPVASASSSSPASAASSRNHILGLQQKLDRLKTRKGVHPHELASQLKSAENELIGAINKHNAKHPTDRYTSPKK